MQKYSKSHASWAIRIWVQFDYRVGDATVEELRSRRVDNDEAPRQNAIGNDPEPELSPVRVRVPERDRAGVLFWPELHVNLTMRNQVSIFTRIFLS